MATVQLEQRQETLRRQRRHPRRQHRHRATANSSSLSVRAAAASRLCCAWWPGSKRSAKGDIRIGEDIGSTTSEPMDRNIAMVFQNYALYPHMSVRQNMAYGLKIAKVPKPEIEKKVAEAARLAATGRIPRPQAAAIVGRPAPARGHGPRDRARARRCSCSTSRLSNLDAKLRVQMRLEIKAAAVEARRDRALRDPRPGRGDDHGGPHDRHERRCRRTDRHAARSLRIPANAVRRAIHRQPGDEHIPGPDRKRHDTAGEPGADPLQRRGSSGEVVVGIRPEHLFPDDAGPIEMLADLAEPLGANTLLHGRLQSGEQEITASLCRNSPADGVGATAASLRCPGKHPPVRQIDGTTYRSSAMTMRPGRTGHASPVMEAAGSARDVFSKKRLVLKVAYAA